MEPMLPFQFEIVEFDLQKDYGRFVFGSLGVGDGKTIGNILRRVLLTNLPALRIVGVKIAGINNEFSTISGVREDVLEILLNLKEVIFKGKKKEVQFGRIKIEGPAIVTASCMNLTSDIEIVNPSHYIATIAEEVTLEIGMILDWGKGYTLAENRPIQDPKSYLETDAVFLPVKNVICNIETSFSESLGTQEQLVLDLWTDGSLTPLEAMVSASETILHWFKNVQNQGTSLLKRQEAISEQEKQGFSKKNLLTLYWLLSSFVPTSEKEKIQSLKFDNSGLSHKQSDKSQKKSNKDIPIEELNLSVRAQNALKGARINLISEITNYSLKDLRKIRQLGKKSIEEITKALEKDYQVFLR